MAFRVESDANLAGAVDPRAAALALSGVAGVGSKALPYLMPVSLPEYVLAVGRATAAIFSPTRQHFQISSRWAIARWFWAFDWTLPNLRLSEHADEIRSHHRTAFSEALGLAAALLVAEHLAGDSLPPGIWNGGPMLLDIDSLQPSGERPDLMILFGDPSGPGSTSGAYVLEAKGNSKGRDQSISQLRRGINQVLALSGPAERLVVGATAPTRDSTTAAPSRVDVHAISVPAPPAQATGPEIEAIAARIARNEIVRLFGFAGEWGVPLGEPGTFELSDLGIEIIGRRFMLTDGSLNAEITTGVDRQIMAQLREIETVEQLLEARAQVAPLARTPTAESAIGLVETGRAQVVASDGCAMSISLR